MNWVCYLIYNNNCSYVGITNNPLKRLRQHNQIIKGGAKYTKLIGHGWQYVCQIHGFKNKKDVLKFEWAVKHCNPRSKTGVINRIDKMFTTLNKEYWTKNSPSSINYNLRIVWYDITFLVNEYQLPYYINQDISNDI